MTSETIDSEGRPHDGGAPPAAAAQPVPSAPAAATAPEPHPPEVAEPVSPPPAAPAEVKRSSPKSPRAAIEPSEVPPPPGRSKTAKNPTIVFLNGIFTLLTVLALGIGGLVVIGKQRFDAVGPLSAPVVVVIPPNASPGGIADLLEKNGVVSDSLTFSLGTRLLKEADRLKAGEYEFPPAASMREAMEIIVEGRTVPHRITFPEGWSSEQIVRRLEEDKVLTGKIAAIPEEGALLPDTYSYARGTTTREQILDQMRKAQDKRLTEVWARRIDGLPLGNPRDLVILASIVEKETGKADERPRVAAVFINRLKRGMRLETDPTVLYGLYGGKAWLEGRTLMRADLASPNPYNTYKIPGLPPGPICNPGRAAMEAVANPSRTDELFFVADGTGGHVFATTLEEHNRNVQRWRTIEQGRRATDAPAPPAAVTPPPATGGTRPAAGRPATAAPVVPPIAPKIN
ncbi:endolytic transglycosylase MltG [Siculibacillus lacustris]|uniref:Endolytic murein transglycosylase n=1 Tax=Siculibacillus lacustris TaxID=1549641 RepID=A0A4Q9VVF2_9HYPH|nr:endolytic transglycosylase MltG [Siculibacillus lacustris]TBW39777.1 endolytic transglycosylase MltG [Siculibacillus lacustris]